MKLDVCPQRPEITQIRERSRVWRLATYQCPLVQEVSRSRRNRRPRIVDVLFGEAYWLIWQSSTSLRGRAYTRPSTAVNITELPAITGPARSKPEPKRVWHRTFPVAASRMS